MRAITFDAALPRYLLTLAAGAVSPALLTGPLRTTRFDHVPEPRLPGDRWVRIRTLLGGICGSDLQLVRLRVSPSASPFSSSPFVIGHENVGVIAAVGPGVRGFAVGERVVANPLLPCEPRGISPPCRRCAAGEFSLCENFTRGDLPPGMLLGTTRDLGGSWGECFVAHESQIHRVPASISDPAALLLEPFASALHPVLGAPPERGARVLVIGAGSIGLLAVAALAAIEPGAEVTVLARYPFQEEEAKRLGAAHAVSADQDYYGQLARISGGVLLQPILGKRIQVGGFDATYVCVSSPAGIDDALRFTRSGGRVVLLGNAARLRDVDWTPVWLKEITLRGSLCYGVHSHGGTRRHTFEIALDLLERGLATKLERLVTHVFPLARHADAFALAFGKTRGRSIKIAFEHPGARG